MTGFLQRLAERATDRNTAARAVGRALYDPPHFQGGLKEITEFPSAGMRGDNVISPRLHATGTESRSAVPSKARVYAKQSVSPGCDKHGSAISSPEMVTGQQSRRVSRDPEELMERNGVSQKSGLKIALRRGAGAEPERENMIRVVESQTVSKGMVEYRDGPELNRAVLSGQSASAVSQEMDRSTAVDYQAFDQTDEAVIQPLMPLRHENMHMTGKFSSVPFDAPPGKSIGHVEETTEVHVNIGRIDVTAVHESPPVQPGESVKTDRPSPMTLDQYLIKRHGRSS